MSTQSNIARLLVGLMVTASAAGAYGVELRTTIQDKTIHRQVSLQPQTVAHGGETIVGDLIEEVSFGGYEVGGGCASCGEPGCSMDCLQPCGRWADVEYLLWWRRGGDLPVLATTSPQGTALNQAGVLGLPTTTVLFGGDDYGQDAAPGARITVGKWLDTCECNAIEGRFFALADETVGFNVASNGDPIVMRPFDNRDANLGPLGRTARPIAFPGIASNGSVFVRGESEVYGADVVLRHQACQVGCTRIDVMLGYQYTRINDNLTIGDSFVDVNPANLVADGTRQSIVDQFDTRNEFHGGLIGIEATYVGHGWRLELLSRLAFGSMRQLVSISGQTTNEVPNDPNSPFVLGQGLLAGPTNQGTRERDEFAVVPELGATMVYQLSPCIDLSMGYSFIYWSNVVQAGRQIDSNLFVPSQFAFNDTSYWVHGLNAGLEVRF